MRVGRVGVQVRGSTLSFPFARGSHHGSSRLISIIKIDMIITIGDWRLEIGDWRLEIGEYFKFKEIDFNNRLEEDGSKVVG